VEHLILVATFSAIKGTEDAARKINKWEPTTQDFKAVANWEATNAGKGCIRVETVSTLDDFITKIHKAAKGTLKSVSLVTHSNTKNLALGGTVDWTNADVQLNTSDDRDPAKTRQLSRGIDEALMFGGGFHGWFENSQEGQDALAEIKTALAPNAEFNFYSCQENASQSYAGTVLLKKIASVFGVVVHGFDGFIWYKTFGADRTRTGFGKTEADGLAAMAPGIFHNNPSFQTHSP
jgi:hypothetical protein